MVKFLEYPSMDDSGIVRHPENLDLMSERAETTVSPEERQRILRDAGPAFHQLRAEIRRLGELILALSTWLETHPTFLRQPSDMGDFQAPCSAGTITQGVRLPL